jgi:carbon-monoxide dehydrogenase medium subunit/xanthine dehydrogenase FAD-binding subunit
MKPFEFIVPRSIRETLEVLRVYSTDAQILAGGTDLLIELRKPSAKTPTVVIDISRLQELKGIEETDNRIIIKPLTTHTEILESDIIRQFSPLLRQAVSTIGSPQIRNRGTIGGNIMNAAACADTVPPLMALDAMVKLLSVRGERLVPFIDFFVKPYQTTAAKDELLTEIRFPKLKDSAKSVFIKLGRRNALAISRLSVAAILQKTDARLIQEARIVPGAAFPIWQRMTNAEKLLIGQQPSKELFAEAGKKVSEAMISFTGRRWSTEYKEPVIAVLVRRALEACQ